MTPTKKKSTKAAKSSPELRGFRVARFGGRRTVYECADCGFVFEDPARAGRHRDQECPVRQRANGEDVTT